MEHNSPVRNELIAKKEGDEAGIEPVGLEQ